MKAFLDGITIKHKGVICDMDCPYFQVIPGEDEDNPFQPHCSLFRKNLEESLERVDECIAADKAYMRKLEIHRLRAEYRDRPFMLRILKRTEYNIDPKNCKTIQELVDAFVGSGKVTLQEIKEAVDLPEEDFNNAFTPHPYPYVLNAFRRVFNFPLGEDITLRDRLNMAARRIRLDD